MVRPTATWPSRTIGQSWYWPHWHWGTAPTTLRLTDLDAGDLTFSRVDATLNITVNSTGKTISVRQLRRRRYGPHLDHQFADGASWAIEIFAPRGIRQATAM